MSSAARLYARVVKPKPAEMQLVSRDLGDVVSLISAADHIKREGLAWQSYDGGLESQRKEKETESPNHGSTLIAISPWTARIMNRRFEQMYSLGHFDAQVRPPNMFPLHVSTASRDSLAGYC